MASKIGLEMIAATHSFAAICPKCGALCAVILDVPSAKREIKRETAEWVMHGLTVSRVTNAEVRARFSSCRCKTADSTPETEQLSLFSRQCGEAYFICNRCKLPIPASGYRWRAAKGTPYREPTCKGCYAVRRDPVRKRELERASGRRRRQDPEYRARQRELFRAYRARKRAKQPPYRPPEGYLSLRDLAVLYSYSYDGMVKLVARGCLRHQLDVIRRGRRVYVSEASLRGYLGLPQR